MRWIGILVLTFAMLGAASASEPFVGVDRVVHGTNHACALASGRVACWGGNEYGQLGNGTRSHSTVAVDVLGLPAPVTVLAAGVSRTCAVAAGEAYCWGLGFAGADSTLERTVPVRVTGLDPGVLDLAVGDGHACALTAPRGVKCWGINFAGQLGIGSTLEPFASTPTDVVGLGAGVARITAGTLHTCAMTIGGAVKCWGVGANGQLGGGGFANAPSPVEVAGLAASALDAGDRHTCAVTLSGVAKCWGWNGFSELGDGTTETRATPADVMGFATPVASISAGGSHTCARDLTGSGFCWGSNLRGQIGNGDHTGQGLTPLPTALVGVGAVIAVEAGYDRTCAIEASTRALKCWGDNAEGALGNGTVAHSFRAVEAKMPTASVAVAAGGGTDCFVPPKHAIPQCSLRPDAHSCAIDATGGVACWGANGSGQLGNGTSVRVLVPTPVPSLGSGMVAVAAGAEHSCALSATGSVKCWGSNTYGQLGDGTNVARSSPVDVVGIGAGVVAVSAGPAHTCALTTAGAVFCWGANASGQLGDGSQTHALTPRQVVGLASGASTISAGGTSPESGVGGGFTCAVTTAGAAKCWGNNAFGQMGGSVASSLVPIDVPTLASGVIGISAGAAHACAAQAGGSVKCWGFNLHGQLGLPRSQLVYAPTELPAIAPGVQALAAGGLHTCATTIAGVVHCWGQIAPSAPYPDAAIAQVPGLPAPQSGLVSGNAHSCAIGPDQRTRCWGSNGTGQLGDGGAAIIATAVPVLASRACAGFGDLDAASPFCSNVTWLVNRLVTLGCVDGSYCPSAAVSRLSMAAFLNRLGRAVEPGVASDQRELTLVDVYWAYGVCGAELPPAGDRPRSVQLDAVVSAVAQTDADLLVTFGFTVPGFMYGTPFRTPLAIRAGRWTQVRLVGSFDLALAASHAQVFLWTSSLDPVRLDQVTCNLRARIDNRDEFPAASPAP